MLSRVSSRLVHKQTINQAIKQSIKQSIRPIACSSHRLSTSSRGRTSTACQQKSFHSSATMSASDVQSPLLDRAVSYAFKHRPISLHHLLLFIITKPLINQQPGPLFVLQR